MQIKPTQDPFEFQREFKMNKKVAAWLQLVTSILAIWVLILFGAFMLQGDMYFRVLLGGFFILLCILFFILRRARKIRYFRLGKTKIKQRLEKDSQDWEMERNYLESSKKKLSEHEYMKHYFIEGKTPKYEDIPTALHTLVYNINCTKDKIAFLESLPERTSWKYITSWEWLKAV